MKTLGFVLLGAILGVVVLLAAVAGVFGQGEPPSDPMDDSDTDR